MKWDFEMEVDGKIYGPVSVDSNEVPIRNGRKPNALSASLVAVEKLRKVHGDDFASDGAYVIRPV